MLGAVLSCLKIAPETFCATLRERTQMAGEIFLLSFSWGKKIGCLIRIAVQNYQLLRVTHERLVSKDRNYRTCIISNIECTICVICCIALLFDSQGYTYFSRRKRSQPCSIRLGANQRNISCLLSGFGGFKAIYLSTSPCIHLVNATFLKGEFCYQGDNQNNP